MKDKVFSILYIYYFYTSFLLYYPLLLSPQGEWERRPENNRHRQELRKEGKKSPRQQIPPQEGGLHHDQLNPNGGGLGFAIQAHLVMATQPGGTLETLLAEQIAAQVQARLEEYLAARPLEVQQMLFTVPQAAIYLGRTTKALQHMIADGKLPLVRDGRRLHLHRADLDKWIEENKY